MAFLGIGIPELFYTILLHRSKEVVEARIIDTRIISTRYGVSYEVKYLFQAALNAKPIGRTGFLNDNLWSKLPEEEWSKAVKVGHLLVRFVSDDPTINAPDAFLPGILDNSMPIVLGLFLTTCIVVIEVRRRRLEPSSPTSR